MELGKTKRIRFKQESLSKKLQFFRKGVQRPADVPLTFISVWLYIKCYFKYNGCITYFVHSHKSKDKTTLFKRNGRELSKQISKTNFSVPWI